MLTYCVKQRKRTQCVPGSETYVMTKNDRPAIKCKCAECGITKFKFLSKREMKGSGFDELIVKGLAAGAKGLFKGQMQRNWTWFDFDLKQKITIQIIIIQNFT